MKRLFALAAALGVAVSAHAQFHYVQWAGTLHGSDYDGMQGMVHDSGNIYAVGTTYSPAMVYDLFGNEAQVSFSGDASNGKAYLGLFNGGTQYSGMLQLIGSSSTQRANSVAVDANHNIYIAGRFGGNAQIGAGPAAINATAAGPSDLFLAKYNDSGTQLWGKVFTGSSVEYWSGESIAIDAAGNIFLAGQFGDSTDASAATFQPDPASTASNMTSAGGSNGFVIKLDSNGNYLTSSVFAALCDVKDGVRVALDSGGNAIVAIETGAGACSLGVRSIYLIKLSNALNFVWSNQLSSTASISSYALAVRAADGQIAFAGDFTGTANLYNLQSGTNYAAGGGAGNHNGYLLRLNADGSYFASGTFAGSGYSYVDGLAYDAAGRLYYSGGYSNNYIDPTTVSSHLATAAVSSNTAIGQISANNKLVWVNSIQSLTANCYVDAYQLQPISYNAIVVGGLFNCGQVNLDFGTPTDFTSDGNSTDVFIMQTLQDTMFADGFGA